MNELDKTENAKNIQQRTQEIAAELGISPNQPLYRYLHPIMVCGFDSGQLHITRK